MFALKLKRAKAPDPELVAALNPSYRLTSEVAGGCTDTCLPSHLVPSTCPAIAGWLRTLSIDIWPWGSLFKKEMPLPG